MKLLFSLLLLFSTVDARPYPPSDDLNIFDNDFEVKVDNGRLHLTNKDTGETKIVGHPNPFDKGIDDDTQADSEGAEGNDERTHTDSDSERPDEKNDDTQDDEEQKSQEDSEGAKDDDSQADSEGSDDNDTQENDNAKKDSGDVIDNDDTKDGDDDGMEFQSGRGGKTKKVKPPPTTKTTRTKKPPPTTTTRTTTGRSRTPRSTTTRVPKADAPKKISCMRAFKAVKAQGIENVGAEIAAKYNNECGAYTKFVIKAAIMAARIAGEHGEPLIEKMVLLFGNKFLDWITEQVKVAPQEKPDEQYNPENPANEEEGIPVEIPENPEDLTPEEPVPEEESSPSEEAPADDGGDAQE